MENYSQPEETDRLAALLPIVQRFVAQDDLAGLTAWLATLNTADVVRLLAWQARQGAAQAERGARAYAAFDRFGRDLLPGMR